MDEKMKNKWRKYQQYVIIVGNRDKGYRACMGDGCYGVITNINTNISNSTNKISNKIT